MDGASLLTCGLVLPDELSVGQLSGKSVVVTRAEPQAQSLLAAIDAEGGSPIALPLLEIVDAADRGAAMFDAIEQLSADDWLVVLSPNGSRRIVAGSRPADYPLLAVIAGGTAAPFLEAGWSVDLQPEVASSAGLLTAFAEVEISGRVLIAQAENGRRELAEGLVERGVIVEVVTAYRNVMPKLDEAAKTAALDADVVVFASPSAVERYVSHIGDAPKRAVCIGGVTASSARTAGFDVLVSPQPTVEAIVGLLAGE